MFDVDRFIADCRNAVSRSGDHLEAKALVEEAVSDPAAVIKAFGAPTRAGATALYASPDLTILNLVWGKHMTVMPHNHRMWAVIGVYEGRENNIFWRKLPPDAKADIEAAGAKTLGAGDAAPLGADIIHSVTNPLGKLTGAIHVYGGDFFEVERSEWDPEALTEKPYDLAKNVAMFEEANRS